MANIRHTWPEDDDPIFDQEFTLTFPQSRVRLGTDEDLLRDFGSDGPFLGSPVRPDDVTYLIGETKPLAENPDDVKFAPPKRPPTVKQKGGNA